eukprot:ctg_428.g295
MPVGMDVERLAVGIERNVVQSALGGGVAAAHPPRLRKRPVFATGQHPRHGGVDGHGYRAQQATAAVAPERQPQQRVHHRKRQRHHDQHAQQLLPFMRQHNPRARPPAQQPQLPRAGQTRRPAIHARAVQHPRAAFSRRRCLEAGVPRVNGELGGMGAGIEFSLQLAMKRDGRTSSPERTLEQEGGRRRDSRERGIDAAAHTGVR